MLAPWRVLSLLLNGDEHSDPERGAGLAGDRPHRHAQGVRRPGAAGARDAQAQCAQRASFCVPRSARWADQGALARRAGHVPVRQTAGARALHLAITPAQLGYLLEGIDWRLPQRTWRPEVAG